MQHHWPPKPIALSDITPEDRDAIDIRLDTMARAIANALDFDTSQRVREGLDTTPDTHLIGPPTWPSHGCLANWIKVLQQARALISTPNT